MLEIRAMMNSAVEEVFGFKTCCGQRLYDQNLEIHVENKGDRPIEVHSHFDLKGERGMKRIDTLMPHGVQRVEPGQTMAFYCFMDETEWSTAREIAFYDVDGESYVADVSQPQKETS